MVFRMNLREEDVQDLRAAVVLLENPGLAARLTGAIGVPLEKTLALMPEQWSVLIHRAARMAISKSLNLAVRTMDGEFDGPPLEGVHRFLSGVSGAVGGFFGAPALMLELPVSTAIMLRSIADIARSEGENIADLGARLACLEVFALGGRSRLDDGAETGYYAVRAALANAVFEATYHITRYGMVTHNAPVLVRLVNMVAARFGVAVSEKFAAQAVPAIGAVGGASINLLFIKHFQDMARGHFSVRRLERAYGEDIVQMEYQRLKNEL